RLSFDGTAKAIVLQRSFPLNEDDVDRASNNRLSLVFLIEIRDCLHFEAHPLFVIFRMANFAESVKGQEEAKRVVDLLPDSDVSANVAVAINLGFIVF